MGPTSEGVEWGARVVLRPIGNPLPLGFLALAGATFLVAALQLGWIAPSEGRTVGIALIAFTFPLQLLTSIFGFLGRDVVAGTAMGVLAGTWLTVGVTILTIPPGATSDALGLLLLIAGVAMLIPATVSATGKIAATAVLATTVLRFLTAGVYELTAAEPWKGLTAIVGLVLVGLAVYVALAMTLEDARGVTTLPLGRRGSGREALRGSIDSQAQHIEREAGVREQL